MTRLQKVDTATLRREYIYADPPISITALSDKYGLARSGVADKARIGDMIEGERVSWYDQREQFRSRVATKVTDAMAEKWAEMQTAVYERLVKSGITYLDKYDEALEAGEIKPAARDMIAVASMMKSLFDEMAQKPDRDQRIVNPEGDEFVGDEAEARDVIERVKALMAGGGDAEAAGLLPGHAGSDAAEGAEEPRP